MKVLFIVAQKGYQDWEYNTPKNILENARIEVITAAEEIGECWGKMGSKTQATISLDKVTVSEYEAIILIGGPGAVKYQQNKIIHLIVQEANKQNKILAAICIAPTILAYAKVLNGIKATVWNEDEKQQKILEVNGAIYTGEEVTIDKNIITANGPSAAEHFGQSILKKINKPR